jgi:T-complex protein 1 subunit theta
VADPGRNKLIINHLGRMFVTSDAATIIREIEVVHPAAKLLVMASQAQEAEVCELCIIPRTEF